MARPIWTGVVSFGLVSVPVRLYTAIGDHTIRFQQYERGTSDRVRYRRVNERTGKEVDYDDIVKGYETHGELVEIESDELDDLAPGRSKAIDIEAFVDLDQIDPIYFQRTYWLAPAATEQMRPYQLLLRALEKTNRAGIAKLVMRGKEYLTALRAHGDLLHLTTLHFEKDIRDPGRELPELPEERKPRGKELDMAVALIESMSEDWRPEDYEDTFNERVQQLIEDKRRGEQTQPAPKAPEETDVTDLYDALSRSIDARKSGDGRRAKRGADKQPAAADLSRAELDRMARDLEIVGRSKMSKDQLVDAVESAAPKQRKRAS